MSVRRSRDEPVVPIAGLDRDELAQRLRHEQGRCTRLRSLAGVSRKLAGVRAWPELMSLVRRAARELTGADGATLVLREGDQCHYADEDAIGPLWKGQRFALHSCISGWVMLQDEAVAIEDIYADERVPHDAYRGTFVNSLSMVPIGVGEPIGAIGCYWAQRHLASEDELELLQALADAAAVAIANLRLLEQLHQERMAAVRDLGERERAQAALVRSEAKYRLLIDQAPDGIFVADGEGHYLEVNPAGAAMLGYSREEILDLDIPDILAYGEETRLPGEIARFADGAVAISDWRFRRKDGSEFLGEVVGRRLPDGRLQGILRDVTQRRRAEAALRESEFFYHQTLESIPGMVFTTRPDGWCDYQSRQWVDYTGVAMDEHLGDGWNALLHPDDQPRALNAWRDAVAGKAPYDLEYRVRRHDGIHEWFRVIGRPIQDRSGAIVRWLGVAINVEQLKRTQLELSRRSQQLEALLDTFPAEVCVKDGDLRIVMMNGTARRAAGRDLAQVAGRMAVDVLPAGLAYVDDAGDRRVRETCEPVGNLEQSWVDDDGNTRWVAIWKTPLLDPQGRFAGLVGVSLDITGRKLAETGRLTSVERQRDALVREVHHRIKNHLQGVTGLLRSAVVETPACAAPLEMAISRIAAIAEVYGLQSRGENQHVRLHDLVMTAIAGAAAPVELEVEPESREIILLDEDAVPLALVINELVTNAIKHMDAPDPARPVRVRLNVNGGEARLQIIGGPARLPISFDLALRRGLGTGLELVTVLLPEQRSRFALRQEGDEVIAEIIWRGPHCQG